MEDPIQDLLKQSVFYQGPQGNPWYLQVRGTLARGWQSWFEPGSPCEQSCAAESNAHSGTGYMRKAIAFTIEVNTVRAPLLLVLRFIRNQVVCQHSLCVVYHGSACPQLSSQREDSRRFCCSEVIGRVGSWGRGEEFRKGRCLTPAQKARETEVTERQLGSQNVPGLPGKGNKASFRLRSP